MSDFDEQAHGHRMTRALSILSKSRIGSQRTRAAQVLKSIHFERPPDVVARMEREKGLR